ncbi:MAG TPA: SBBP repeat-containing protein [Terriglobia bacterium]|nr:SBBP repeat-containing protein [Terriglobia bacterium]
MQNDRTRKRKAPAWPLPMLCLMGAAVFAADGPQSGLRVVASGSDKTDYGTLPLSFEANQGQTDSDVRFLAHGPGYSLFLTADEAVLALRSHQSRGISRQLHRGTNEDRQSAHAVQMKLVGANANVSVRGIDQLPGKINYFIGNDPKKWRTGVPTYGKVKYESVYPGIDLVYYGNQGHLEYDFVVAPGADPGAIRLALESATAGGSGQPATGDRQAETRNVSFKGRNGASLSGSRFSRSSLSLAASGDLIVKLDGGELRFHKPVIYQPEATSNSGLRSEKLPIEGHYRVAGHQVSLEVSNYDHSRPLIIDPVLSYSTYLGGTGQDIAYGIAVDGSGAAYITGVTGSLNFPVKSAEQSTENGSASAFVAKLNSTGSGLIYSTYLGGSGSDSASAIAIDSTGNAYVAGSTSSVDFPVTAGVFQGTFGGVMDAFIAKLNPTGSSLVYATYLGGSATDLGQGIAINSAGDAYVTGSTQSPDFPTANPLQIGNGSCTVINTVQTCSADAFVAEVNSAATALVYSTYLGGSSTDSGQAIAVDPAGNAVIAGYTYSSNFPTQSPFQPATGGGIDAFLTELDPSGTNFVFSTYLGGNGQDQAFGLALDNSGNIYVTGGTQSADFPTTPGAFQSTYGGSGDAFLSKLSPNANALLYSTFIGGTGADQGNGVAVDSAGDTVVVGVTQSTDFPIHDPLQSILGLSGAGNCTTSAGVSGVCSDAFVTRLGASGSVSYSTYLGGTQADFAQTVAMDSSGTPYVAGSTSSSNFPVIGGALEGAYAGAGVNGNAFIAKVDPTDAPGVALSPQSINFGNQALNVASAAQTVILINAGSLPLQVTSITATGNYAVSNNCGTTVSAGGGSCTISVTFTPTTAGPRTDEITITDNAAGSPHQIAVTGTGVNGGGGTLTLTPKALVFPVQVIGTTSPSQVVQLVNGSQSAVTITAISASGDFAETNTCGVLPNIVNAGSVLNAGASCAVTVTFTPTASGSRTGSLTITDNASSSPSAGLSGTGGGVFALSASKHSSNIVIGTTSTTFTITAEAASSFTSSISLACSSGVTCSFNPATITAGQTTTLTVTGLSATSPNPSNVTVTGTSGSNTSALSLSVFLQDFSVTATPPLANVTAGKTTTYSVTVTGINGFNGVVLLSCSSALPNETDCSWAPSSGITLNGSFTASATLSVTTTTQQTSRGWPRRRKPGPGNFERGLWTLVMGLTALFAALLAANRRRLGGSLRARYAAVVCILLLTIGAMSCENYGYNVIGTPVVVGTPTGVYVITISGTLGTNSTVIRSTSVNLSVAPG